MQKLSENEAELHAQFVEYGANAKTWMRKCVLLLPEIDKHRVWQKKGFSSIYEYAAKLAGMSRNTVDDALRILAKIENKPSLQMVVEAKGLGAVRPVISMATPEDEMFWARKAAAMSKSTLETYVREFKKQEEEKLMAERRSVDSTDALFGLLDAEAESTAIRARPGTDANRQGLLVTVNGVVPAPTLTISMTLDRETAEMLLKLKGQGDWNSLMKELLELREQKLQAEEPEPVTQAGVGRGKDQGKASVKMQNAPAPGGLGHRMGQKVTRYIPTRIKKHVLLKTRGQCAYSGCTKPHEILHHTKRFALQREHDPKTLMPLCQAHERLAHHGLIDGEQGATSGWRVREEADRDDLTYAVDRRVMQYRKP